jgi:hypothetical protein
MTLNLFFVIALSFTPAHFCSLNQNCIYASMPNRLTCQKKRNIFYVNYLAHVRIVNKFYSIKNKSCTQLIAINHNFQFMRKTFTHKLYAFCICHDIYRSEHNCTLTWFSWTIFKSNEYRKTTLECDQLQFLTAFILITPRLFLIQFHFSCVHVFDWMPLKQNACKKVF